MRLRRGGEKEDYCGEGEEDAIHARSLEIRDKRSERQREGSGRSDDTHHAIPFEDFIDTRFAEGAHGMTAWKYEAGDDRAR